MNLSPLAKGLITAAIMISVSLLTFYNLPSNSPIHYVIYGVYAGGIVWTLIAHKLSPAYTGTFTNNFNAGFRCFIIVTFLMVAFTFIFNKLHPEFAKESAKAYKEYLLKEKNTDKTPDAIEDEVKRYEKGYATTLVYGSIFGYLIIGAIVTASISLLLIRRNN
jgi:hypothetical protein